MNAIPSRFFPHLVPARWAARGCRSECTKFLSSVSHLSSVAGSRKHNVLIKHNMTVEELAEVSSEAKADLLRTIRKLKLNPRKSGVLAIDECEKLVKTLGLPYSFANIIGPAKRTVSSMKSRPPVVAVMGHVDHGKTTLLDSLRQTTVAQSEAGGITQHIGAFSGSTLTFLDTPGHAAFSNMRARGAQVTDMVVLVVAADDGVKEQTVESIKMIRAANVPMVVAINKCDKHVKNIERVKQELLGQEVQLEDLGGEVQGVQVSALKGEGLDALEEALLALADISQLRADYSGPVQGVVIETRVDKGQGAMATVLIQHGTLCPGDILVAGVSWCKVRIMQDHTGRKVAKAPPSTPVLITGWKLLPTAGDACYQATSEKEAKISTEELDKLIKSRGDSTMPHLPLSPPTPEGTGEAASEPGVVPLIVKGDVMGSVEALVSILETRQPKQKVLKVVHTGVGPINEGDLEMAFASKGVILAFGVDCPKSLNHIVHSKKVKIITNRVIYKLLDDLRSEIESSMGMLVEEEILGMAEVIQVFRLTGNKSATIGGSIVQEGKMMRSGLFRVTRKGKVVHEGELSGMRTAKQDVSVAIQSTEVGFKFAKNVDFQEGDKVICFKRNKIKEELEWNLGF